jgi:hypothetical protein
MSDWSSEFIIAIVSLLLAILAIIIGLGVTLAMDAKTKGEFRFVVGCFVFSAIMVSCSIGAWTVTTEATLVKRVFLTALAFSVLGVSLVEGIRWANQRHRKASKVEAIAPVGTHLIAPTASEIAEEVAKRLPRETPSVAPGNPKALFLDPHKMHMVFTEIYRIPSMELEYKDVNDLENAINKVVESSKPTVIRLPYNQTEFVGSVILSNGNSLPLMNGNISIGCTVPIKGLTGGAKTFSDTEVNYDIPKLIPFSEFGSVNMFSISINVSKPSSVPIGLFVTVNGENLRHYTSQVIVQFVKGPPPYGIVQSPKPLDHEGANKPSEFPKEAVSAGTAPPPSTIQKNSELPSAPPRAFTEYQESKKRLESDPDKLTLYDLYAIDFGGEVTYPHVWRLSGSNGSKIDVESEVVWQLGQGIEFIKFYIPYTKETHDVCVAWVAQEYQNIIQATHEMGATQKIPGESEEVTSKQLVFSKRIYVYHEAYLSPEEVIDLRNGFQKLGITILFRSSDYLANQKLQAKVKLLEGAKKDPN